MTRTTGIPPRHPGDSGEVTEALDPAAGRLSRPPPLPARPASSLPPPPQSVSRMKPKTAPPPLPQAKRPAPTSTAPAGSQRRFRVSIKTSVLDPSLLVVRRLEEGMELPAGASEGWLEMSAPTNVDEADANRKSVR